MKKIVIVVFLLLIAILTQAQSREISGKITDELGNPIAGATVQVKGAELIARSDANGWYKIQVPLNASTLTFSYSGKKTSDIQISQTNAIDIVLSPENDDIFDLSLEQLLEIKISTASKKEERIADIYPHYRFVLFEQRIVFGANLGRSRLYDGKPNQYCGVGKWRSAAKRFV